MLGVGVDWSEEFHLVAILWHCLTKGVLYDEAIHVANRDRALGHAA